MLSFDTLNTFRPGNVWVLYYRVYTCGCGCLCGGCACGCSYGCGGSVCGCVVGTQDNLHTDGEMWEEEVRSSEG